MLKWIGVTALVIAMAVMTLGCVRGLVAPTATVETQTETAKPVSVPAGIISSEVTAFWRGIGIYRPPGPLRLARPGDAMTPYQNKAPGEAAQQAARAQEAPSRDGPTAGQLSDRH